ncbi:MAG: phenylalanine--tRNA ligase subunit alpha [Bacilli bacterium]
MKELNDIRVEFLGKKGPIVKLYSLMKTFNEEEKKQFGNYINNFKITTMEVIEQFIDYFKEKEILVKLEQEKIDISLPSKKIRKGSKHPMTRIEEELEDLFVSMGYDVVEGPEIDSDDFCFKKLNLPDGHPARDAQDTFYLKDDMNNLLRPHTSPVQVRTMLNNKDKKPIRIVCPGKVYRRDDDATHSHQFMQFEGLVVGEDISLADLKGTLELFSQKLLGKKTKVRFRPSYFPFTEPSVEVDVTCFKCGGKGCSLCKQTGFIEVLGAGIVHPNVLSNCGYDPLKYTGFAFGPGLDRFTMFKYGITDIRYIYGNDIRFLEQFARKDEESETK